MRERGLFVAEGRAVVRRVLDDSRYQIEAVLVNEASRRHLADALDRLPPDVPVHVRDTSEFESLTGHHLHRGCLALVRRPAPRLLEEVIAGAGGMLLVLDGVTDADNVGGVFRNAAAFGAGAVVLGPGCCDPLYRKAVRTSMGAVLRVPFACAREWPGALDRVRAAGLVLAALTPREPAETLEAFAARRTGARGVALIVGAEGAGVSAPLESMADARVRIPTSGAVDSLNLSVAAAIAMYTLRPR